MFCLFFVSINTARLKGTFPIAHIHIHIHTHKYIHTLTHIAPIHTYADTYCQILNCPRTSPSDHYTDASEDWQRPLIYCRGLQPFYPLPCPLRR